MEQAEKDPEVQVLSRQFKAVAGDLISLLEQVTYLDPFEVLEVCNFTFCSCYSIFTVVT